MIFCNNISLTEGIDLTKSKNRKECILCHNSYFNDEFNFQKSVCNGCHL